MLGSPLLGTAVGLVLMFATAALLCSGITESIATVFQMRARYLLTGLRDMLDAAADPPAPRTFWRWVKDVVASVPRLIAAVRRPAARSSPEPPPVTAKGSLCGTVMRPGRTSAAAVKVRDLKPDSPRAETPSLAASLFATPLLRSLQSKRVFPFSQLPRNPQYVSARAFARALVDLLAPVEPGGPTGARVRLGRLKAKVAQLPDHLAVRGQLLALLDRAGGDLDAVERALEQWYDEQMAKINGWYKRWARVVLGVVGLVVAFLLNLDTVSVARTLYVDAPVQQAVVASADAGSLCQNKTGDDRSACVQDELTALSAAGLPIGYPDGCQWLSARMAVDCWPDPVDPVPLGQKLLRVLGWAITAFAVSFGAPFWFEALSRLGSLRNAGTRPDPT